MSIPVSYDGNIRADGSGNLTGTSFIGQVFLPPLTTAYGAGSAYSLNSTPALLNLGTTPPSISLPAGEYRFRGCVLLNFSSALIAGGTTATIKLHNTTDNTDYSGSFVTVQLPVVSITPITQTFLLIPLPEIDDITLTGTKTIEIWGSISTGLSSGNLQAVAGGTWLIAESI